MALILNNWRCELSKFTLEISQILFEKAQISCVLGASGSGKSTLLQSISGFVQPTRGSLKVEDRDLSNVPPEKRQIALAFQRPALFPHWTVFKNIEFPLRLQKKTQSLRTKIVNEWLEKFELTNLATHYPNQISEGQAQRVSLARALATDFPVILLDEPFSALDVGTRNRIRNLFKDWVIEKKKIAVLVTHHPDDATESGDRTFILENGRIKWSGSQAELQKSLNE